MHESPDPAVESARVSPSPRIEEYSTRVRRYDAIAQEQRQRSLLYARARLGVFLLALAALVWAMQFGESSRPYLVSAALFVLFALLVVRHARVEEQVEWFTALQKVNERNIARIRRDWDALPGAAAPEGIDEQAHPYAVDLDLFGRASLFQWLGPAATTPGSLALARWILEPAPPGEILVRQQAVSELAPQADWRERLAALGIVRAAGSIESLDRFLRWAESSLPPLPAFAVVHALVYVLLASMWGLIVLHLTGVFPNHVWPVPMLVGMIVSFVTAYRITHEFDAAGAGERTFERYAAIFEHICTQQFAAGRLVSLQERLSAAGRPAPAVMRRLNTILGFANLRRGAAMLHFPVQLLTLWDFHCLFALMRWRRRSGGRVRDWFDASGEVDSLSCLAAVRHDNPDWCFAVIADERKYVATALGHPLIEGNRRVANDVEVGPPGTVLLVTGSNMSGKSTLLRAIGLNALLAQCGAPACAAALRLPPCDVQTSIRIQDSLERGISYFMAALARLKQVVDAAEREPGDRVLLYLLDEILQGTNSAERGIAVQAVARHLLEAGAIGAMTTHDLTIAAEEPLRSTARLVHFSEVIGHTGEMQFDYRLREGLATSRNALRLMKLIGIEL